MMCVFSTFKQLWQPKSNKYKSSPIITLNTRCFFDDIVDYDGIGIERGKPFHLSEIKIATRDVLGRVSDIDWDKLTRWVNKLDVTSDTLYCGLKLLQGYNRITIVTLFVGVFLASKFHEDYSFKNVDIAHTIGVDMYVINYHELELLRHNNWVVYQLE